MKKKKPKTNVIKLNHLKKNVRKHRNELFPIGNLSNYTTKLTNKKNEISERLQIQNEYKIPKKKLAPFLKKNCYRLSFTLQKKNNVT